MTKIKCEKDGQWFEIEVSRSYHGEIHRLGPPQFRTFDESCCVLIIKGVKLI